MRGKSAKRLVGRSVTAVFNATHPHKFTWYSGDPLEYPGLLTGRKIVGAKGHGAFIDVLLDDDIHLTLSDGVNLRLYGRRPMFRRNTNCF